MVPRAELCQSEEDEKRLDVMSGRRTSIGYASVRSCSVELRERQRKQCLCSEEPSVCASSRRRRDARRFSPGGVFDSCEENILDDSAYVYDYLNMMLGIDQSNMIVFGRSMGSGPSRRS